MTRTRGRPNTTGGEHVQQPGQRGGYRARFVFRGEWVSLGRFDSVDEAAVFAAVAFDVLTHWRSLATS